MSKKYYIYGLFDPRNNELRYVGATINISRRLTMHCTDTQLIANTYKNNWIKSLKKQELKPIIEIIETYENKESAIENETYLIQLFRKLGYNLTNSRYGGNGFSDWSEARKLRNGLKRRGIKHTEKTKNKISMNRRGIGHTQETKDTISRKNTGKKLTNEQCKKISLSKKGKKKSPEAIKNNTLAQRKINDEIIKQMREMYIDTLYSISYISKFFNINYPVAYAIINNTRYKDDNYTYTKYDKNNFINNKIIESIKSGNYSFAKLKREFNTSYSWLKSFIKITIKNGNDTDGKLQDFLNIRKSLSGKNL
jgi:predicted GIY-YIG superfamily endonuclease